MTSKPANILYNRERDPGLIDFGLATSVGDSPCRGGTPWYIPPEMMQNSARGAESDVFALSVTTLYLLRKFILPERNTRYPPWRNS